MALVRALEAGLRLRTLDVSHNRLFNCLPALARELENHPWLTDLNLAATAMGDAGAVRHSRRKSES
jgi:hypothetical protein